jgi:hypothetical protein
VAAVIIEIWKRAERALLDPLALSEQTEEKLVAIFEIIDQIETLANPTRK